MENRKSYRASWHEYNGGEYFVTICTNDRIHYFGEIVDGAIQLTAIGEYLKLQIENTGNIRDGDVTIPLYTIMPNHVHIIVSIHCRDAPRASDVAPRASDESRASDVAPRDNSRTDAVRPYRGGGGKFGEQSKNLASVIRGIKCSVTKYANENHIPFAWQSRYHDHIIRNQNEMNRIAEYIENNPLIWWRDRNNIH